MSEEVKPEVIKKTQDLLGKYVKRPPLTDKLLRKPPFRFLHDVITCVIRETGFLKGVFTPEELNHENIKDKEGKVKFLQKLIDVMKTVPGSNITARPSKIVAGHEPTKTNELLQAIGRAVDSKISLADSTSQPPRDVSQQRKEKKLSSKSSSKQSDDTTAKTLTHRTKDPSQDTRSKERKDMAKKKSVSQQQEPKNSKVQSNKKLEAAETVKKDDTKSKRTRSDLSRKREEEKPLAHELKQQENAAVSGELQKNEVEKPDKIKMAEEPVDLLENFQSEEKLDANVSRHGLETTRKSARHHRGSENVDKKIIDDTNQLKENTTEVTQSASADDSEAVPNESNIQMLENKAPKTDDVDTVVPKVSAVRPKTARIGSARPMSARPAAPRIRDRGEVPQLEDIKPSTGKVNIITENDQVAEQDESENYLVDTQENRVLEERQPTPVPSDTPANETQHGHLVTQILETQKELEDSKQIGIFSQDAASKKVDIEWEDGQRRERDVARKEVERLRASIQMLTRVANPLGKLMDFFQEDVDSIQRELEFWKSTKNELQIQLTREESETERTTQPLKRQLQHIQKSIEDQHELISSIKNRILQNDLQIKKLVTGKSS